MTNHHEHTYRVRWSAEDGEWVATVEGWPSRSSSASTPTEALDGLLGVLADEPEPGAAAGSATAQQRAGVQRLWVQVIERLGWTEVVAPLLSAGWESEDALLWMVAPRVDLAGRSPADLVGGPEAGMLREVVEQEALGVW